MLFSFATYAQELPRKSDFNKVCGFWMGSFEGPQLNNDLLKVLETSNSKLEVYAQLKEDKVLGVLNRKFTLMKQSESLQEANVDEEHPRPISFAGTLVLAASGHAHPKDSSTADLVEGIAYNLKAQTLNGVPLKEREIVFFTSDYSKGKAEIKLKPKGCQSCHFGRYNWETYNTWPGSMSKSEYKTITKRVYLTREDLKLKLLKVFSEKYDDEGEVACELCDPALMDTASGILIKHGYDPQKPALYVNELLDLLEDKKATSLQRDDLMAAALYSVLRGLGLRLAGSTNAWYLEQKENREMSEFYKQFDFETNQGGDRELNSLINKVTMHRFTEDLASSPSYEKYRYAALGAIVGCGSVLDFLTEKELAKLGGVETYQQLKAKIEKQIKHQYTAKLERLKQLKSQQTKIDATPDYSDIERIAALEFMFSKEGLKMGRYSSNFYGRQRGVSYGFAQIGAGQQGLNDSLCYLLPKEAENDPRLRSLMNNEYFGDSNTEIEDQKLEPVCKMLRDLSLAHLE